jgi:hypothetical protein
VTSAQESGPYAAFISCVQAKRCLFAGLWLPPNIRRLGVCRLTRVGASGAKEQHFLLIGTWPLRTLLSQARAFLTAGACPPGPENPLFEAVQAMRARCRGYRAFLFVTGHDIFTPIRDAAHLKALALRPGGVYCAARPPSSSGAPDRPYRALADTSSQTSFDELGSADVALASKDDRGKGPLTSVSARHPTKVPVVQGRCTDKGPEGASETTHEMSGSRSRGQLLRKDREDTDAEGRGRGSQEVLSSAEVHREQDKSKAPDDAAASPLDMDEKRFLSYLQDTHFCQRMCPHGPRCKQLTTCLYIHPGTPAAEGQSPVVGPYLKYIFGTFPPRGSSAEDFQALATHFLRRRRRWIVSEVEMVAHRVCHRGPHCTGDCPLVHEKDLAGLALDPWVQTHAERLLATHPSEEPEREREWVTHVQHQLMGLVGERLREGPSRGRRRSASRSPPRGAPSKRVL